MRAFKILVVLLVLSSFSLFGQTFPISDIPTELRKGADVVLRQSKETLDVSGVEATSYRQEVAYTIFNQEGFGAAIFYRYYDKLSKLKGIKISYYDAEGRQLKKVKSSEIEDINITSAGSVYDDNRVKYYKPEEYDYPFTVVFEYESVRSSTLQFFPFLPQITEGIAVQKATYQATVPDGYALRYRELNGIDEAVISRDGKQTTYTWSIENEPAIEQEIVGEKASARAKSVLLAPSLFSVEGYQGDMTTWQEFGKWQYQLNQGRDELPADVSQKVKDLVADASDDKEKVRRVYDYLQNNTRYVSIQLGIGGWQPFPAAHVAENGYGDCKALSNYTASLLKAAGIKSNYVVIKAGGDEDDIVTDFPSNQFNHVILAVPLEKDTVWLECTSQEAPFNFLGGFTSDRHGLMVTENGGVLVKTPEYSVEQNSQIRRVDVVLDEAGNASAEVKTVYKGRQYDSNYRIAKKGSEDQRKYLLNVIDIPAFDLGTFGYKEEKTEDPRLVESYDLTLRKYASVTGKRLFFLPNLLNRRDSPPPRDSDRKSAIIRRYNYLDVDSVVFKLPENYRLEFEPEPVEIDSEFGEYRVSYHINPEANELTYVRYIKVYKGKYPANSYSEFRDFWRKVSRSDKSKLVLIGST